MLHILDTEMIWISVFWAASVSVYFLLDKSLRSYYNEKKIFLPLRDTWTVILTPFHRFELLSDKRMLNLIAFNDLKHWTASTEKKFFSSELSFIIKIKTSVTSVYLPSLWVRRSYQSARSSEKIWDFNFSLKVLVLMFSLNNFCNFLKT